jgi:hypothetical protein
MEIFEVRRTCCRKLLISWKNGRIRIAGAWGRLQQGISQSKIRHVKIMSACYVWKGKTYFAVVPTVQECMLQLYLRGE